jgi:hypothetical protein
MYTEITTYTISNMDHSKFEAYGNYQYNTNCHTNYQELMDTLRKVGETRHSIVSYNWCQ